MKLLLHACCGPCSLEPVRLLRAAGHDLTIAYMNSNIAPADEYARRLATLRAWAADVSAPVVEGAYDPAAWEACAGPPPAARRAAGRATAYASKRPRRWPPSRASMRWAPRFR